MSDCGGVGARKSGKRPQDCRKPAQRQRRTPVRPFKQGHLDGLCVIYAIINGFRLILGRQLNQSSCEALFDCLTQYAVKEQGMLDIITGGIGLRQMQQLLAQAVESLEECTQGPDCPRIHIQQPWRSKPSQIGISYAKEIKTFLHQRRTAAIIGIEHPHAHWSVLRADGQGRACFFDSDHLRGCTTNKLKFTPKITQSSQRQLVLPQAVFLLASQNNVSLR